jgi:hypothetical protein
MFGSFLPPSPLSLPFRIPPTDNTLLELMNCNPNLKLYLSRAKGSIIEITVEIWEWKNSKRYKPFSFSFFFLFSSSGARTQGLILAR